jgi:hypothetical protein
MTLSPRLFSFRKKVLPYLHYTQSLVRDAVQWANKDLQTGILSETSNITTQKLQTRIEGMHLCQNHFLKVRNHGFRPNYWTRTRETVLKYSILILSPFQSIYADDYRHNTLTDLDKDIINRLFPVGVNGFKKDKKTGSIKLYMEFNRALLEHLVDDAQFFIFADCLSGDFNKKCAKYLEKHFDISNDRIYHTNKRHSKKYWDDLAEVAETVIKKYGFGATSAYWLRFYMAEYREQWSEITEDDAKYGLYAHKFGKIRHVPGLDLIHIHKVPDDLAAKCKEYYDRTGRKALVVLMDDSVSKFSCTAKSIANQIGPYGTLIVIATMFEF